LGKDYYQILGINKDAGLEQIKAAYRKLALEYHPDRNKENPEAAQKMKEINEAYAVLSDPQKRKEYDALWENYGSYASQRFRESYSEEDIFRGSDIDQIFEQMARAFGFRNFEEIFKEFYGSRYQTFEFRRPGFVGRGFVYYGFRPRGGDYIRRGEEIPRSRQGLYFPTSPSGGIMNRLFKHSVEKAFGIQFPERGRDLYDFITLTPEQAQEGDLIEYSGHKWGRTEKIMVKAPPGIKNGQRIRLKGMGLEGKGGAENGDLYLEVKIRVSLWQIIKRFFQPLFQLFSK